MLVREQAKHATDPGRTSLRPLVPWSAGIVPIVVLTEVR